MSSSTNGTPPPNGRPPPGTGPLTRRERRRLREIEAALDGDPTMRLLFGRDAGATRRTVLMRACRWSLVTGVVLIVLGFALSGAGLVLWGMLAALVIAPIAWFVAEPRSTDP
ncbi:DUF3040 domain-containing protein [Pseudonocardia nematodicida]|uniref:DUF3040 domain-containing protein n=1 Tax=Pseudonocardia nematodicida TaxID=1206997 RepID=A0ABV1K9G8_9PSEU